jgi:hypothetical protein
LLGTGPLTTIGGLQYALGPIVGLAGAALLAPHAPRRGWWVGGALCGLWAVHLGGGYLANLALTACFLAAAALLTSGRARVVAAAAILGAGALAHPQFFALAAVILHTAAVWSHGRAAAPADRRRARALVAATAGAAAVLAIGLVALLAGGPPIAGDTSKDAFLRRAGRWDALRVTYLRRLGDNVWRYGAWGALPLAALGALGRGSRGSQADGSRERGRGSGLDGPMRPDPLARLLIGWAAITAAGLGIGALTGWFPPDRLLTFAFCIPLLAGLGVARLLAPARPRRLLAAALVLGMAAPSVVSWWTERGFLGPEELEATALAARIAAHADPGTPLVYVVDGPGDNLFEASHALNTARGTVPVDRVRDVRVYVGEPGGAIERRPTVRGTDLFDLASAMSVEELPRGRDGIVFVVADFVRTDDRFADPRLVRWSALLASTAPRTSAPPSALPDEVRPSSPAAIAAAALVVAALLGGIGLGWSRLLGLDRLRALALAPAIGLAALVLAAVGVDRLGLLLGSRPGALVASALAAGSGYALRRLRGRALGRPAGSEGQAEREPSPKVDEGSQGQHEQRGRDDPLPHDEVQVEPAGKAQGFGGPQRDGEQTARGQQRPPRPLGHQPGERQGPRDVPGQEHGAEERERDEEPPPGGAELGG